MLWLFLLLLFVHRSSADLSFKAFCANPPNFGKGEFDASNLKCRITYQVKSSDENDAFDFCDMQNPYSLEKAVADGDHTTCHLAVYYECDKNEVLIGDRCFRPMTESVFDGAKVVCTDSGVRGMALHKVTSVFEQKWIAAFFSKYNMLWISNREYEMKLLYTTIITEKVIHNKEGRLVRGSSNNFAIITSTGSTASFRRGTITAVSRSISINVLCSRSAPGNHRYIQAMTDRLNSAGIKSYIFKDANNKDRPFTILRWLVEFEMGGEYDAGSTRLHQSCKALRNGYAASPLDFKNVNDFKNMLKKEQVNVVAVPGRRDSKILVGNDKCVKERHPENYRRHFYIELVGGGLKSVKDDKYWRPGYPDRYCADTPRTALGFSQEGLVDMPNIVRLFVVCTFGEQPAVSDEDFSARCSKYATYDKKSDTCICKPPFVDIKHTRAFVVPPEQRNQPYGTYCVNCAREHDFEIVLIAEYTMKSWDNRQMTWQFFRLLSFIGYVTKSRFWYGQFGDAKTFVNRLGTPSNTLTSIRSFLADLNPPDYLYTSKIVEITKLAKKDVLYYASSRKLLIYFLTLVPEDLDQALGLKKEFEDNGWAVLVVSFNNDERLKKLSSYGEIIKLDTTQNNIANRGDAISRIQQTMLYIACVEQ